MRSKSIWFATSRGTRHYIVVFRLESSPKSQNSFVDGDEELQEHPRASAVPNP